MQNAVISYFGLVTLPLVTLESNSDSKLSKTASKDFDIKKKNHQNKWYRRHWKA